MSIRFYLLNLILLSFLCFTTCQNTNSEYTSQSTQSGSTSVGTTATVSVGSSTTSGSINSSAMIDATSIQTSVISSVTSATATGTGMTSTETNVTSLETSATATETGATSTETNVTSSGTGMTSTATSVTSSGTSATATGTGATSAVTTTSSMTNISATYIYRIQTDFTLRIGNVSDSNAVSNVTNLVQASFNFTNVTITKIEIQSTSRIPNYYNLLIDILFLISSNCTLTCINQNVASTDTIVSLPLANGTLIPVSYNSTPTLTSGASTTTTTTAIATPATTATTVVYPTGGPSPGIPAQLGMGLGISFIGVLLIAEMAFFYWKFGLSNTPYRQEYGMTPR